MGRMLATRDGTFANDAARAEASKEIFTEWQAKHSALWGNQPLCLGHRLHEHPLFSRSSLASLIERYPASNYMLVKVGPPGREREWREGDFGCLSGEQVITAIEHGSMWLNLLRVNEVDSRFGALLDDVFGELEAHIPAYQTFNRICGILISSPQAQVYYHFDTSGQSLWQIAGSKRVYVYPASSPFLARDELESVCLYNNETNIRFENWYDDYASIFTIGPGQMLSWPLNAPHRVENLGFSVSMTVEYQMRDIQRKVRMNGANCLLREQLGINATSRTSGPGFWAKTALLGAAKLSGFVEAKRRSRRPITFHLHPDTLGDIIEAA
jgi:hypothetical protein